MGKPARGHATASPVLQSTPVRSGPSPSHLAAMHQRAQEAAVACLDTQWQGSGHYYRFRCPQGHEWLRREVQQRTNPRCNVCSAQARSGKTLNHDNMRKLLEIVRERGGVCLDNEYRGTLARYRFRCAAGHEWDSNCHNLLHGAWCRQCSIEAGAQAMRHPDGLARLQAQAAAKGGHCLSKEYLGSQFRHHFRCAQGHEWQAKGQDILLGGWCLHCSRVVKRLSLLRADGLAELQQFAAARGGECLSGVYLGTGKRHDFRCAKGHEWQAFAGTIISGSWCRRCAADKRLLTIEHAQRLAHERGGRCLSERYVKATAPLTWECHRGHVWQGSYNGIQQGRWCKECANIALLSNRKSKARKRYDDAGARLFGLAAFDPLKKGPKLKV